MATFRLKETHPISKKAEILSKFMEDNKIAISRRDYGGLALVDNISGEEYNIMEEMDESNTFPTFFEYHLTFEKN